MAAGTWIGEVTIYALCDPDSLAVRYVGKANNMRSRINSHRWEAKSSKIHTRKANWLRSLKGREPVIMILAVVKHDEWAEAERYWIAEMRNRGSDLTNYADGGQTSPVEGKGHTEETKLKLSKNAIARGCRPPSQKGIVATSDTRKKLSEACRARNARPPERGGWNKGVKKTHCNHGHEFMPENTRIVSRSDRTYQACKICEQRRTKTYLLKKKD